MARSGLLLVLFSLFLVRFCVQNAGYERILDIAEGTPVQITGQIYKKEFKKEEYLYYLRKTVIETADSTKKIRAGKVCLRPGDRSLRIGDQIRIETAHRHMERGRNQGSFDERRYYHSLGIGNLYYSEDVFVTGHSPRPVKNGLFFFRERLRRVYVSELNEKDAGILSSMILGDKTLMEEELKGLYSGAGISHILAVSGLHVSMIGLTVFEFLRKRRCRYPFSCLCSGVCLFLFCMMSGMSISALRAGLMFLVYLGAQLLGRKYSSLRAMGLAASVTLLWNPAAIYNAGFYLSYLAVAGAVGIGGMSRSKEKRGQISFGAKILLSVKDSLRLSSCIMLATMPISAYFFYEIPLYGMLANVIILPLAGIVMGSGFLGGCLGLTMLPGMWISFIPCHVILRLYEGVCRLIRLFPAESVITGQPKLWMLFLYYGIFVWIIIGSGQKKEKRQYRYKPAVLAVFLAMVLIAPGIPAFQISYLDVGQGDGIYMNMGDGRTFMIDGGSVSEQKVGTYQILPFLKSQGTRSLDGWIVTHGDKDHISGMLEVIKSGYPVKELFVSEHMVLDDNSRNLFLTAKEHGISVVAVSNGDYIKGRDYRLWFYTPAGSSMDRNEASLVTVLEYREDIFLFTGDISAEQESWLLNAMKEKGINGPVTILKSAHHGSMYSNSPAFLEGVSPGVTVISVGEKNQYGHPHKETLDRMEEVNTSIYMTKDAGEIRVKRRGGNLRLRTRLGTK